MRRPRSRGCSVLLAAALLAAPAVAAPPEVSASTHSIAVGSGEVIELEIRAGPGELQSAVSVGELLRLGSAQDGVHRFRYVPSALKYPHHAIALFWTEGSQPPEPAVVRLSLRGRTELPVETEAGAEVRVEIGGKTFGPARADRQGKATLTIEVPPGVREAKVLGESRGQKTVRTVPIDVPPAPEWALVISPTSLRADRWGWGIAARASPSESVPDARCEGGQIERASSGRDPAVFRITPDPAAQEVRVRLGEAEVRAAVVQPPPPPPIAPDQRGSVGASVGAMVTRGLGYAANIEAGYRPRFGGERVTLEARLGLRRGTTALNGLVGPAEAEVLAMPLELGARVQAFERDRWVLYLAGGGGPLFFQAQSAGAPASTGFSFDLFGAVQGAYRLAPLELFAEMRGTIGPLRVGRSEGDGGGLSGSLGARFYLR